MTESDVQRLAKLWSEEFGDDYVERNRSASEGREPFWRDLHREHPFASALEVGCNIGGNLRWLTQILAPHDVFGIDVNDRALSEARANLPGANLVRSEARRLPFRDALFDLVFTTGVLIHQPPAVLPVVMSEIVRCSRGYVLCGEYFSEQPEEVPYRGQTGALFRRDWGALYAELFPELELVFRSSGEPPAWDDVTFWLFRKRRAA